MRHMMPTVLFAMTVVGAATGWSAARADGNCPGTQAALDSVPPSEVARVCEAARWTEATLAQCGISPSRHYSVRLADEVRSNYGYCIFGQFRSNPDVASIVGQTAAAALLDSIPDDEPMSVLKALPTDELFRSLIVHEISHAILHQNLKAPASHAVHEYVAGVSQLGALSAKSRAVYLARFSKEDSYTEEMFNDLVVAMDPARYAAAAYRHFHRPENGCTFMRRLLTEPHALPLVP